MSDEIKTPEPEAPKPQRRTRRSGRKPAATGSRPEPAAVASEPDAPEPEPRFHFFLIDAGWKSASAQVVRDNFRMIREFQNHDPLYVLTREQSVAFIRANPGLIGKDPILLVHDLQARGGKGESGYHGFQLCLGLLKKPEQALKGLQQFLRFIAEHRKSADIEKDILENLHRRGLEGAIQVIREGSQEALSG